MNAGPTYEAGVMLPSVVVTSRSSWASCAAVVVPLHAGCSSSYPAGVSAKTALFLGTAVAHAAHGFVTPGTTTTCRRHPGSPERPRGRFSVRTEDYLMASSKIIGIDLGTTNSVVAVMEGGDPVVIPNAEGGRTTPSVVAFTKDGERLVGQVAKRQAVTNPKQTIFSIKRFMGRRMDEVKEETARVPYKVDARHQRARRGRDRRQEVHAARDLRDDPAEDEADRRGLPRPHGRQGGHHRARPTSTTRSGRPPRTPARSPASRSLRIINEPTAAALAYGLDKKKDEKIAVFDLGGGTYDISVLELAEGVFEVKSTNGDTHLGGDDFDQRLIDWLVAEFKKDQGIDLSKDAMALQRLKEAAEKAKMELSSTTQTDINLPFITADAVGPEAPEPDAHPGQVRAAGGRPDQADHSADAAGAEGCRPQAARNRRGHPRRRLDPYPEDPGDREGVLRQGAQPLGEPGRSRGHRRGDPGRRPRRRGEGRPPARRHPAVARHRDAGRRDHRAHPAEHHHPDQEVGGVLHGRGQPDHGRDPRAAGRAADGRRTTGPSASSSSPEFRPLRGACRRSRSRSTSTPTASCTCRPRTRRPARSRRSASRPRAACRMPTSTRW